eukprot:2126702-Rhodomonas_salina.1
MCTSYAISLRAPYAMSGTDQRIAGTERLVLRRARLYQVAMQWLCCLQVLLPASVYGGTAAVYAGFAAVFFFGTAAFHGGMLTVYAGIADANGCRLLLFASGLLPFMAA